MACQNAVGLDAVTLAETPRHSRHGGVFTHTPPLMPVGAVGFHPTNCEMASAYPLPSRLKGRLGPNTGREVAKTEEGA